MATLIERGYWNLFLLWHARRERALPFMPLEHLRAIQHRRVQAMVAHAYATVPYYRTVMDERHLRPRDFQTADDLACLPVLTSDDLAHQPERFRSRAFAPSATLAVSSSGTSGHAKTVVYDHAALFLSLAAGQRQRHVVATSVGRLRRYREMIVERVGNMSEQIRRFYETYSWVPRVLDYERANLYTNMPLDEALARLDAFQPTVLRGYADFIGAMFRHAHRHRMPVRAPQAIIYGANTMPDYDRALIEREFGVPVFSSYQAAEALRIAFQCERRAGFHISLDQVAVRVVDERGAPVAPGARGHLVLSNLTNRAMVLLNYRLGDVVTLGDAPCACGRTLPLIERIDGRSSELVTTPDGRTIAVVDALFHSVPGVAQVQVVQLTLTQFELRVVCAHNADWTTVRAALAARARVVLGEASEVAFNQVELIPPEPNGKVRSVISHHRP